MTITGTPNPNANVSPLVDDNTDADAIQSANNPATEQTFLQLLVAQLKNQDPMNPADGMQFVSELAQFSQLEQTIAIRQDMDLVAGVAPNS